MQNNVLEYAQRIEIWNRNKEYKFSKTIKMILKLISLLLTSYFVFFNKICRMSDVLRMESPLIDNSYIL